MIGKGAVKVSGDKGIKVRSSGARLFSELSVLKMDVEYFNWITDSKRINSFRFWKE